MNDNLFCIIVYGNDIPAEKAVSDNAIYLYTIYLADEFIVVDVEIKTVYQQPWSFRE